MTARERFDRLLASDAALLSLAWLAVWGLAAVAGVRFETFELRFWHVIDPVLLRDAPLDSLFHLHSQPPLWNAALAAAVALVGDGAGLAVAGYLGFAGLALATSLATTALARDLAASRAAGLAAGLVVLASPTLIAYGHTLFHALPATFLVTAFALAARRAAARPTIGRLAALVGCLTAGVLLWAAFHPLLLGAALLWLGWCLPGARRRLAAVAAPAVALVAALAIKNAIVCGSLTLSSWSGMNLARVTAQATSPAVRSAAIERGALSSVSRARPFSDLDRYPDVPRPPPTGVALLDRPRTSSGEPNLHALAYAEIARRYGADARRTIADHPLGYLAAAARGFWRLYLHPASDYHVVAPQIAALGAYVDVYQAALFARVPGGRLPDVRHGRPWPLSAALRDGVVLRLGWLALLLGGPLWLVRLARAGRLRQPDGVAAAALVGALLYVTLACNLFELGENQRFRFTVEPAAAVVAAVAVTALVRRVAARISARRSLRPRSSSSP